MSIELGGLRLDVLSDGEFRLDGGAMFGMVPRERWREWCPPDERNRIRLATHSLLVRGPGFRLVIEGGIGGSVDRCAFAVAKESTLETSLLEHGLAVGDITHATHTHLHFDHTGGGDRFPAAVYFEQRAELMAMASPSVLHRRSYHASDRPPEGRLEILDGDAEILPGVRVRHTGGHTPGHQVVILEDAAIFWGDLFPTRFHLSPPRTMAYDLAPLTVVEKKIHLLKESAGKRWLNFLYHELDPRPGRILEEGGRFRLEYD